MACLRGGGLLIALDKLCLGVFLAELVLKLLTYRSRFWRSGLNVFDFLVVAVAIVPDTNAVQTEATHLLERLEADIKALRGVVEKQQSLVDRPNKFW